MRKSILRKLLLKLSLLSILVVVLTVGKTFGEDVKTHIREALNAGDTAAAIQFLQDDMELDKGYHYNYYTLAEFISPARCINRPKSSLK